MSSSRLSQTLQNLNQWSKILILGNLGNALLGGLIGLIGSLILRHHPSITITITWLGSLAGLIGGSLHAILFFITQNPSSKLSHPNLQSFTLLPCFLCLGSSSSYYILIGHHHHHPTTLLPHPFNLISLILTLGLGTLTIFIYSTLISRLTTSDHHLLLLYNLIIILSSERFSFSNPSSLLTSHNQHHHHQDLIDPQLLTLSILSEASKIQS